MVHTGGERRFVDSAVGSIAKVNDPVPHVSYGDVAIQYNPRFLQAYFQRSWEFNLVRSLCGSFCNVFFCNVSCVDFFLIFYDEDDSI